MTSLSLMRLVRLSAASLVLVLAFGAKSALANDIVVCKVSDVTNPVPAGTEFSFTIDGTPFTLTVGGDCAEFPNIGAGSHVITEAAQAGTVVSAITVDPADRLVSLDLTLGTVTAEAVDDPTPTTVTFFNATETTPGNQGCTPGFWKQDFHFSFWVGYSPDDTVGSVFTGVDASLADETLLDALQGGGGSGLVGAEKILLRAAVAALLNASSDGVAYAFTTAEIISAVNTALGTGDRDSILALASSLDAANNGVGGCPLGGNDNTSG